MALKDEADLPAGVLEADYNARASVPVETFETAMDRYRAGTEAARQNLPGHLDLVYDQASGEALDILGCEAAGKAQPLFLFIHGGYWRALSKNESGFMAETLHRHGVATAAVDYTLAPKVTLAEIVRQVRAALAFLWHEAERLNVDRDRIFVGGSSAGGHLTGALISQGWQAEFGLPANPVRGALPVSGLFDLAPIARTFPQEWLSLSEADVAALSPARHVPEHGPPVVVAYAAGEPAGFARQSQAYHRLWRNAGAGSTLLEIPERNHFDIVLDLADDESRLARALLELVADSNR